MVVILFFFPQDDIDKIMVETYSLSVLLYAIREKSNSIGHSHNTKIPTKQRLMKITMKIGTVYFFTPF